MAGSAVPLPEFVFGAVELLVHGQQPGEVSVQRPLRNPQQRGFQPQSAGLNGGQRGCPSGAGPDAHVAGPAWLSPAVGKQQLVRQHSERVLAVRVCGGGVAHGRNLPAAAQHDRGFGACTAHHR